MFVIERVKIIKKYLQDHKQLEVTAISSMLGVSEVTIRRDLEKLEKEKFLIRTHGGAILNTKENEELPDNSSQQLQDTDERKAQIADIAVCLIQDNDIVMLTNGEINLEIARRLSDKKNITVLTNDIAISLELRKIPTVKAVLLGGDVSTADQAVYGNLTISNMKKFFVKKLFIEADGISKQHGITVSSTEKASLIQGALPNASSKIVMCTSNCFDKTAFYWVSDFSIASTIITNSEIDASYKDLFFKNDIQLFTSLNMYEFGDSTNISTSLNQGD